jgi:gamma-glutamyltranspeptidase / glutathione hydrolase
MKGAVAAGHPLTAEAGARILAEGGNAVDACIAAAFVSWVAESPLTGPGGGGFMLVHRARDQVDSLLDFFVAVPGQSLPAGERGEMQAVDVAFDERTTQVFHIGPAAVAVPGVPAGLAAAHSRYATLPWAELLVPAVELARAGVPLNSGQAFFHEILDVILRSEPEGRRIYGADCPLGEGERVVMDDLAGTLEWLAAEGAAVFYRGDLARCLSEAVRGRGGAVTEADLAAYRVIRRRPVRAAFRGAEFVSNPPPSSGGLLIAFVLRVLDRLGSSAPAGSPEGIALLVETMREAALLRGPGFVGDLYRGGAARRILAEERVRAAATSARAAARSATLEPTGVPSTTHISVVDANGNAASLSASTGCGSGVIVPGTGVQMNNMLGEPDLNPPGAASRPGARLTSMMAPSLLLEDGWPRLVVGSAGSIRLRAAIVQIVLRVVDDGLSAEEAIEAPRVHLDDDVLQLEGGIPTPTAAALEEAGYAVNRWAERNLYFGGASAVALLPDGRLEAAGDSRRGGVGVVVGA